MQDLRFFESLGPLPVGEVCAGLDGTLVGDSDGNWHVVGVAPPERAAPTDICYVAHPRGGLPGDGCTPGLLFARKTLADALVSVGAVGTGALRAIFVCNDPRSTFAAAAERLWKVRRSDYSQQIAPNAHIVIAPTAYVDPSAVIGDGTRILPGAVVGPGVHIGRNCEIGVGVSVECALIGDRVRIGPHSVIGKSGYGVVASGNTLQLMPHLGRVILQDNVGLGGHVCVDRGVFDDTVIGENTQIDNFCQIAHNCKIGRNVVMAAFGGISGSTRIGDGAQLGGRVAVADHGEIEAGASLAAGSMVMHVVPSGETWGGYPASPIKKWLREVAWLRRAAHRRGGSGE